MFILVDCNNFFVSCERLFNPALLNKPVIVLSSNDGCVISRSSEAKALNIPMGIPLFKIKDKIAIHNIRVLSSNFALYSNMSKRIMASLRHFTENLEVYSVDEAFLKVTNIKDLNTYAKELKNTIEKWTGIPISIGIGPTKTLAKIANYHAKKAENIYIIENKENEEDKINTLLEELPVEEIWGIGKKLAPELKMLNIHTAFDLKNACSNSIRKRFSLTCSKIVYELNNIPCLEIEEVTDKKSICVSKSFNKPIADRELIEQALANFTAQAAKKLRGQNSVAKGMIVFLQTNRFMKEYYGESKYNSFFLPVKSTPTLTTLAKATLAGIFKENIAYTKVGIILCNLIPEQELNQYNFFQEKENELMIQTFDKLNNKYGDKIIFYASQGIKRDYMPKSDFKSPNYIGNWQEIPMVS